MQTSPSSSSPILFTQKSYISTSHLQQEYPECIQNIFRFDAQTVIDDEEMKSTLEALLSIESNELEILCYENHHFRDNLVDFLQCATSHYGMLEESVEILKRAGITDSEQELITHFFATAKDSAEGSLVSAAGELLQKKPISSCHQTYTTLWAELDHAIPHLLTIHRDQAKHIGIPLDEDESPIENLRIALNDKKGEIFTKSCLQLFESACNKVHTLTLSELESLHLLMRSVEKNYELSYDFIDEGKFPRYKESLTELLRFVLINGDSITSQLKTLRQAQAQDTTLNKCKQLGKVLLINALFAFAGGGLLAYGGEEYRSVGEVMIQASLLDSTRAVSAPVINYVSDQAPSSIRPYVGDALYVGMFVGSGMAYNAYREPILRTFEDSAQRAGDRMLETTSSALPALKNTYESTSSSIQTTYSSAIQTLKNSFADKNIENSAREIEKTAFQEIKSDEIVEETPQIISKIRGDEIVPYISLNQTTPFSQTLTTNIVNTQERQLKTYLSTKPFQNSAEQSITPYSSRGVLENRYSLDSKKNWQVALYRKPPKFEDMIDMEELQTAQISSATTTKEIVERQAATTQLVAATDNISMSSSKDSFKDYVPSMLHFLIPTSSASSNKPSWMYGIDKVVAAVTSIYKK